MFFPLNSCLCDHAGGAASGHQCKRHHPTSWTGPELYSRKLQMWSSRTIRSSTVTTGITTQTAYLADLYCTWHTSAKWVIVPQRHEACVWERACECVFAPWAHGCWRGRISCSQMLQDAAPTESLVWPGRIRKTAFTAVPVLRILNFHFHAKQREKQHLSKRII